MYETGAERARLQELLDRSVGGASAHLRMIVDGERRLDADAITAALTGMCVLAVATVTARGEPRVSALDGHFLHGHWIVGTDGSSVKARHLAARPAVSAAHLRGEELGVFTHGTVEPLYPGDPEHPDWPAVCEHLSAHYGRSPLSLGDDVVYYRIRPHWMVGYGQPGAVPQ